jgi:hypothetical protein
LPRKLIYDLEEGLQPKVSKRNYRFFFVFLSYFCLDTKVPKNQGKKKSARSPKQLSGSNKTRKRQAVLKEPLSCLSFTAPPPLLFAGPAHVLRGGTSSF